MLATFAMRIVSDNLAWLLRPIKTSQKPMVKSKGEGDCMPVLRFYVESGG